MEKRSKVRSDVHEMVLLSHLKTELKYAEYRDLNLRNLEPLRNEVEYRILRLSEKDSVVEYRVA
jgi:hypothetical protein